MPVLLWLIYPYVLWTAGVDTLCGIPVKSAISDQGLQEIT